MALAAQVLVRISAQAEDFNRTIKRMEKKMESLENTSRRVSRGTIAAFAGLAPAIIPVGAAAVGAAGAIGASFAAAGVAVAGFGAVAVTVLKDVFNASEDIQKINEKIAKAQAMGNAKQVNKLLKERAAIMSQLGKEQQRAANALADFKSFWDKLAKSFEKPVVNLFIQSLNILKNVLKGLEPAFKVALNSLGDFFDAIGDLSGSKAFQEFFKWVETNAGPAITSFGTVAMNVFGGVINLLMAFTPLTKSVQDGLVGMSQKFLEWTQSLKGSESFKAFLDYVQTNGPKVMSILKSIGNIAKDVAKALAPLGSAILTGLKKAFEYVSNNLGPLVNKIAEGIKKGDPKIIADAIMNVINRAVSDIQGLMAKINWGQVAKAIGTGIGMIGQYAGTIIPGVVSAFQKVFSQIPWSTIATTIASQAGKIAPQIAIGLVAIIDALAGSLPVILPAVIRFGYEFANAAVNAIFDLATWQPLWDKYGWQLIFDMLTLVFMPARWAGALGGLLGKIPIVGKILEWLITSINKLGGPARDKFKSKFDEILKGAKDGFQQRWPEIKQWLIDQASKLADWLKSKVSEKFKEAAKDWVKKIKDGILNLPSELYKSGQNAAKQLAAGLRAKAGEVVSAAKSLAKKIKDYLGFSSPTKLGPGKTSHKWAPNFVKMFAGGITKGIPQIERAATSAASATSRIVPTGGGNMSLTARGGTAQSGGGHIYNINIQANQAPMTERDLLRMLREVEALYG